MGDGKRSAPNRVNFGKLKGGGGAAPSPPPPRDDVLRGRKRSLIVGLIALGAGSVALSVALSRKSCDEKLLANPNDPCKTSSSRSGSGWSRGFHFGSGSSSTGSTSSHTTGKSAVSHGGFGATGSHFSGHGG
jgi:hypothetical protein